MIGIVALCAAVAVAAIVGGTVLMSRNERTTVRGAITKPRPGPPPLQFELGLRADPEARALRQAQRLFETDGKAAAAATIFRRYHSLEAQLGLAFATWTGPGSLGAVQRLAAAHPDEPVALLNLGWADYQAGRNADALAAWQKTARNYPDSPYAVDAEVAISGRVLPGLPPIVVLPAAVPAAARADLLAGVHLWDLKHTLSARRKLAAAAKLAPHTPETLVAVAVARYSPLRPLAPFPHLGPLTAEFPRDSIVRLHLGFVLLWSRQIAKGEAQLRKAATLQPTSTYARAARKLLHALAKDGS